MEIDKNLISISGNGYQIFQTVFTKLYEAFSKGQKIVIVRNSMDYVQGRETKEESAGLSAHTYYHSKRVLSNLHLNGFAIVYKRKPEKPANLKQGEKVYSFLEVHPTDKGFEAFKNGAVCPLKASTYGGYGGTVSVDSVGIGKGYPGYDYLKEKFFDPARERYGVAFSRWYDWEKAFDLLFETKLAKMKTEEAKVAIDKLIDSLVQTLPQRRTSAAVHRNIEKCAKLPFA